MKKMKETELEKKYELNCHVNCPFFPFYINSYEVPWSYSEDKIKKRKKSIEYICGYDGHVIKKWTDTCPYKERKEE